jgi:hypothetical protein
MQDEQYRWEDRDALIILPFALPPGLNPCTTQHRKNTSTENSQILLKKNKLLEYYVENCFR